MDKLINLIRSLSAKEKNQYVKFARQHLSKKEANKVKLFQLISKQIRGQIKDYSVQAEQNFAKASLPSLKTNLYNQLLTSLSLHSGATARSQASQMIDEIQILMDRGLLKQALSRIDKAKKLIEEHHLHFQFLELSVLHRRIIRQFKTRDVNELLKEEQEQCVNRIQWIQKEFDLLEQYENHFVQSRRQTAGQQETYIAGEPQEKLQDIHSFEGKVYYHLLWRQYYRNIFRKDKNPRINKQIHKETAAILQLFDEHPSIKAENLPRYLLVLYIYLNANTYLGNNEEVEQKLEVLSNISTRNFYEEAQKESTLLLIKSIYFFYRQQFGRIASMTEEAWKTLERYKVFISFERLISISYNLGVGLYLAGDADQAWKAFNYCLQKQDYSELKEKVVGKEFGKYVQASAHLFRLIAVQTLNEKEDYVDLSYSLLASTQHYLKQHKINNPTYQLIFNYLRTSIQKDAHQPQLLSELRTHLKEKPAYKEYAIWIDQVALKNNQSAKGKR